MNWRFTAFIGTFRSPHPGLQTVSLNPHMTVVPFGIFETISNVSETRFEFASPMPAPKPIERIQSFADRGGVRAWERHAGGYGRGERRPTGPGPSERGEVRESVRVLLPGFRQWSVNVKTGWHDNERKNAQGVGVVRHLVRADRAGLTRVDSGITRVI